MQQEVKMGSGSVSIEANYFLALIFYFEYVN